MYMSQNYLEKLQRQSVKNGQYIQILGTANTEFLSVS